MDGYKVEIINSSKELSAKERILMKDTSSAIKLDDATQQGKVHIKPTAYVVLAIHNEKSDNKDYENYLVLDENGDKYVTGSESFWSSFKDIWDDMSGESEEWAIEAYRLPSKNRSGKDFITCSII
jgi:hypothetical protein